jgi:hypothetical protein
MTSIYGGFSGCAKPRGTATPAVLQGNFVVARPQPLLSSCQQAAN